MKKRKCPACNSTKTTEYFPFGQLTFYCKKCGYTRKETKFGEDIASEIQQGK